MVKAKKEKSVQKKKTRSLTKIKAKPVKPKTTQKKPAVKSVVKAVKKKTIEASLVKPKTIAKKKIIPSKPTVREAVHIEEAVVKAAAVSKESCDITITAPKKEVISQPPATAPIVELKPEIKPEPKELELKFPIILKDLAVKLQEKPSVLIKTLLDMKVIVGINQTLDEQLVVEVCRRFGFSVKKAPDEEEIVLRRHHEPDTPESLQPRPPIVTFMGHVDHGKTSLLDAIRKTKVAEFEHGGITQHIGAYRVKLPHGEITFLDTPGHEAFSAMRARGASVTDIVVLVVAADDGVMPQTVEAIDHARAAGVSIIVAINKIDKPQANIDMVKKKLMEFNLTAEDWGGKTITVPVSAKTGQGIDDLLEMILLEAQMLELKANPNRLARGVVLEAKMSKGRGPVATLLVQNGTLHLNENIVAGNYYGKIRAMFDDRGHSVTAAGPSFPVEVLGLSGIPAAGEQFFVIEDEKTAKELALRRQEKEKLLGMKAVKRISLEDLHSQIEQGKIKELKIIIKADVQGSLEAIKDTLDRLKVSEIKLDIIHEGIGNINSSDVVLAAASNALILGFNVGADERAKELIEQEGVEFRVYNIIYELANDIKQAIEGMLEPKLKKVFLGRAEVKKVFRLSRAGTVAGCFIVKGKITRTALVNLVRNGEVIFEGNISSLKRFKDDVRDVQEGFECGISLGGFDNIKEGDIIEAYEIEKIARKL